MWFCVSMVCNTHLHAYLIIFIAGCTWASVRPKGKRDGARHLLSMDPSKNARQMVLWRYLHVLRIDILVPKLGKLPRWLLPTTLQAQESTTDGKWHRAGEYAPYSATCDVTLIAHSRVHLTKWCFSDQVFSLGLGAFYCVSQCSHCTIANLNRALHLDEQLKDLELEGKNSLRGSKELLNICSALHLKIGSLLTRWSGRQIGARAYIN